MFEKKILFIAPFFYGYADLIKNKLKQLNADVDFFYSSPKGFLFKLISILNINIYNRIINIYYKIKLKKLYSKYDYVFIIKGEQIPIWFYKFLKVKYANASFIQYLWDDVSLSKNVKSTFKYFDKIFSFNSIDCNRYRLIFRPFFYNNLYNCTSINKKYDLYFIGSYTKKRFDFLKSFLSTNSKKKNKIKIIFTIHPFTFIKELIPLKYLSLFTFHKISHKKMMNYLFQAKCIIDVPSVNQEGLTTRSFEAILSKTKIITTNKNIRLYDFYNSKNILIIDQFNSQIDKQWINADYEKYSPELTAKYSLDNFINDIFELNIDINS